MLITEKSTESYAKRQAGGKGYNLFLLSGAGFPVPRWVVLGAFYFQAFRESNGVAEKITGALSDGKDLAKISEKIRQIILSAPFPQEIEKAARLAYQTIGAARIAVRSSGLDEDSSQHSFAGQLSTFLHVRTEDEALEKLKECWASGFSERCLSYRIQNGMVPSASNDVAVVFQQMVESEKSGVVFTCDPIDKDPSRSTINSVYGIGEGLVSGLLDADTYLVDKKTHLAVREEIVAKEKMLVGTGAESGLTEVMVESAKAQIPSLTVEEVKSLSVLAADVEKFYRFPQDIEWAWREGKFYLLQARPVTTEVRDKDGTLYIWDNSNIVESYGGITLPLTFTFAHFVYHQVYVQFCEILLIPQKEIRNMDFFLRNMLGLFYGRVYYNLLNWYKLTSILPGFKYNREFMETMMGTSQSLADEIADRIKPPGFEEKFSSRIRRFITGLKFLYFHYTIQSVVDKFHLYFYPIYDRFRAKNYARMPANEIFDDYQELERVLLREWKAPIINDYLCMVHFGVFKKLTALWLGQLGPSIQNDLLCGDGNLESAEPTRELIRMGGMVSANPALKDLIEKTPAEDCREALEQSTQREFRERVANYIDRFGFRCMSEMKLEQRDLTMDPSFLFVCLKNYLKAGNVDLKAYEAREKEIRHGAEKKVRENLGGWRSLVYAWSLKHARKAVRNRENTRFCRTRVYGVVRRMFYGIGRDFASRGILERMEDVFYLTLPDLSGALEGTLAVQNLKSMVDARKKEYERFQNLEPAPRFMTRGPVYWQNDHFPEEVQTADEHLPPGALKGTGCCPGKIEGVVKVILSPDDNLELNGEILVTMRTDPGWIPLYPSVSGLLVERGGLLSHSAIVAREMGLPTVVGIKGLTKTLKSGMRVRFDGQSGLIEILEA